MSDQNHDFVSLGLNIGTHRVTISASSVAALVQHLNDLTEIDEVEGVSAISDVLKQLELINKAAMVSSTFANDTPPASPDGGFTPGGYDNAPNSTPNCSHGAMNWRTGVTKAGPNAGKPYKGWFCTAPRGQNQCKPQFVND